MFLATRTETFAAITKRLIMAGPNARWSINEGDSEKRAGDEGTERRRDRRESPLPFKRTDDPRTFVKRPGGGRFKNRAICNATTKKVCLSLRAGKRTSYRNDIRDVSRLTRKAHVGDEKGRRRRTIK